MMMNGGKTLPSWGPVYPMNHTGPHAVQDMELATKKSFSGDATVRNVTSEQSLPSSEAAPVDTAATDIASKSFTPQNEASTEVGIVNAGFIPDEATEGGKHAMSQL